MSDIKCDEKFPEWFQIYDAVLDPRMGDVQDWLLEFMHVLVHHAATPAAEPFVRRVRDAVRSDLMQSWLDDAVDEEKRDSVANYLLIGAVQLAVQYVYGGSPRGDVAVARCRFLDVIGVSVVIVLKYMQDNFIDPSELLGMAVDKYTALEAGILKASGYSLGLLVPPVSAA